MLPCTAKKTKCFDIYILMISFWFCGAHINSSVHMDACWLKYIKKKKFNIKNLKVWGTEGGRRNSQWVLKPCSRAEGCSIGAWLGFGVIRRGHSWAPRTRWALFHSQLPLLGPWAHTPAPLLGSHIAVLKAEGKSLKFGPICVSECLCEFLGCCVCSRGRKVGCWYSWFIFCSRR